MNKVDNKTEQDIYNYLSDRFGLHQDFFSDYFWYSSNSGNIYLGPKEFESRLKITTLGIVALRKSKTYKPTTNFLQLFGPFIKKSLFSLSLNETIDFCKGIDIIPNSSDREYPIPGFVAVTYEKKVIGCGHWNGEKLSSLIPKSRRTHLSISIQ